MKIFEQELTVELLVKYAETEKIWLPEFQRSFVWDYNQIRLLIDSLFHNYTISSILIWDGLDELARRRVGGSIKEIKTPETNENDRIVYLLDGQQRTTSLTLCFTDKPVYLGSNFKKKEVINLFWDTSYQGDDPEQRWVFDDEVLFEESANKVALKNLTQEEIFKKYGARFVKLKHAYNWSLSSNSILSQMDNDSHMFIEYMKSIQQIQKDILYRRVFDIEQKGSLEQVLEVFERINTKNTKLSIYDIMVAKTYRKIENDYFDLRKYLLVLNHRGPIDSNYFKNIEKIDLNKASLLLNESDMLPVISIMLNKEFKLNGALKLKTNDLIENVKLLHDKFQLLIELLNSYFNIERKELSKYQPIIKFLSAFITHFDKIEIVHQKFIKEWFWNTLLFNRYPGSQNERIAKDFKLVQENDLTAAMERMKSDNTRNFNYIKSEANIGINIFEAHYSSKNQQLYRAMLLLLKSRNAKDFYSGVRPLKENISHYELEEHHIFPINSSIGKIIKDWYKAPKTEDIINNIANIALITRETNNNRIKKKNPSVYISEFEEQFMLSQQQDEFTRLLDSQFINQKAFEALKKDDFEAFIFERNRELLNQIYSLCNNQ